MSSDTHVPVLLDAVLDGLNIKTDGCYVDATFGRGGHSKAVLEQLGRSGRLIGIDRDPDAIAAAPQVLKGDPRFELIRGENAQLEKYMAARNLSGKVDGLLLDLGVSSPQLDEAGRGFSFLRDGPLDMRMDPGSGRSARAWLAAVEVRELTRVLKMYGEENHAQRIARAVGEAREKAAIATTAELVRVVESAVPQRYRSKKTHPATKTFQAIRIAVNGELEQLKAALEASLQILRHRGRICVISFHSLEDRIVKRFFRDASREPEAYRGLPDIPVELRPKLRLVGRAITAAASEVTHNPRARSARLRIAERC